MGGVSSPVWHKCRQNRKPFQRKKCLRTSTHRHYTRINRPRTIIWWIGVGQVAISGYDADTNVPDIYISRCIRRLIYSRTWFRLACYVSKCRKAGDKSEGYQNFLHIPPEKFAEIYFECQMDTSEAFEAFLLEISTQIRIQCMFNGKGQGMFLLCLTFNEKNLAGSKACQSSCCKKWNSVMGCWSSTVSSRCSL